MEEVNLSASGSNVPHTETLTLEPTIPLKVSADHVYSIFYTLDQLPQKHCLTREDYQLIIKEMMNLFIGAGSLGGETTKDVLLRLEHFFFMRENKRAPNSAISLVSPFVSGLDLTKQ